MQVSESEWKKMAVKKINRYLHRGGDFKGDEPQRLGGSDLLNTIGVAMGLPVRNPEKWTESEKKQAVKGKLVYFEGDALKKINVVAEQIIKVCDGDYTNDITVLPIELYKDGILVEVPLFRVQQYAEPYFETYYVDDIGRYYNSFSDWYNNNKLPPCHMAYPTNLRLTSRSMCACKRAQKCASVSVSITPSARDGADIARYVDNMFTVTGVGAAIGLFFVPGAAPLVIAGMSSSFWSAGRSIFKLHDKATHGESLNPITHAESRLLWLGVADSIFSIGAAKATQRLMARGLEATTSSRRFVNALNTTSKVVGGINKFEIARYIIENYDLMKPAGVLMLTLSVQFWSKSVFKYKILDTLMEIVEDEQL